MDLPNSGDGTRNATTDNMSKIPPLTLSDRDKTPASSGWGYDFHHTDPQRRVPCVLGDMLAPKSADDIPPITPEAMTCVQAAITLLANLVGDRDHGRFLGDGDAKLAENHEKARIIASVRLGLAGILQVAAPSASIKGRELPAVDAPARVTDHALLAEMRQYHAVMTNDERSISKQIAARDLVYDNLGRLLDTYERVLLKNMRLQNERAKHAGQPPTDEQLTEGLASIGGDVSAEPPSINLHVTLSTNEIVALTRAHEHVRVSMAHQYSWKDRDAAMDAINKVHRAATTQTVLQLNTEEIGVLTRAHEHVRVSMAYPYGWEVRDAAMSAIGAVLDAHRHAGHPQGSSSRDAAARDRG